MQRADGLSIRKSFGIQNLFAYKWIKASSIAPGRPEIVNTLRKAIYFGEGFRRSVDEPTMYFILFLKLLCQLPGAQSPILKRDALLVARGQGLHFLG